VLEVVLMQEDTNSESAVIVEWLAGEGEQVRRGEPVCVVETAKAAIEIESPGDGTICHLFEAGEEVEFVTTIALVAETPEELVSIDEQRAERTARAEAPAAPANATRKAIELAEVHGIDLGSIRASGFITAKDVQAVLERRGAQAEPAAAVGQGPLAGISSEGVTLPEGFGVDAGVGRLDDAFLESVRGDPEAFRALPEAERLDAYRRNGARIGEGVRLGERTLIVAPQIVIDRGVVFGDDALVRCEEAFAVGALTHFGPRFELACQRAYIGANGHIGRSVRIGGGGWRDPWATLVVGDLVFIGDEAYVNPCRPVVIGREVFLTMRSMIVTHNIGHSVLEGFENRFAPVVLEDRSQVGLGAVVYAGCRIGRESIVASNSYVVSDVPPGKLAAGVPAKVTGASFHPISRDRQVRVLHRMIHDLRRLLELRGVDVSPLEGDEEPGFRVSRGDATSVVVAVERIDADWRPPGRYEETVVLALQVDRIPPGCVVLDLLGRRIHGGSGIVADSVREFCRKRGIRFEPGPWRYGKGLI
jgi:acetyltransferase-like isoleucine patch superfamily enzyme